MSRVQAFKGKACNMQYAYLHAQASCIQFLDAGCIQCLWQDSSAVKPQDNLSWLLPIYDARSGSPPQQIFQRDECSPLWEFYREAPATS